MGGTRTREENILNCRLIWQAKQAAKRERIQRNIEEIAHMTPMQRLARLDERLGPGVGAKRERARLWRLVTEAA